MVLLRGFRLVLFHPSVVLKCGLMVLLGWNIQWYALSAYRDPAVRLKWQSAVGNDSQNIPSGHSDCPAAGRKGRIPFSRPAAIAGLADDQTWHGEQMEDCLVLRLP